VAGRPAAAAANAAATETARLREMAELSSDWFWEQDAQFRYTAMSGGGVNKGNFRIDQALGKTRWELPILGVSEAEWARHRAQLERHEPFFGFAYQVKVDDGDVRWFSVNGKPVFDAAGAFAGYRGTGHDISAQRNAEAALKESEQRLALAMEAAGAGVWDYDPLEHKTYFSPRFADLLGYPSDEALHAGFNVAQALHPEDRERVLAAQEAALREGHRFDQNYRLQCRDGAYRWFRGVGLDRTDADGRVTHFIGALTDVTAQIEAEQALRESEAQLNRAQKVARLGSWHRDLATKRLTWSLGNYRLCGIAPGTPLTRELLTSLLHPDDRERVLDTWNGVMQGKAYDFEHRILVDGETRWLHDKSEIAFDDEGRHYDHEGNLRDWWAEEDAARYLALTEPIVRQYGGYVAAGGERIDGRLTLGENIADIGGLKLAYLAYRAAQGAPAGKGEGEADALAADRRFFIAYAASWREKTRRESERLMIATDPHAPTRFRVNGPLRHMPEFARAFACPAGKAAAAGIW